MAHFAGGDVRDRRVDQEPTVELALGLAGDEDLPRPFDRWLKGDRNGIDREPAVRYYVLGDTESPGAPGNEWRTAESWPPPARVASFFLTPAHGLEREPPSVDKSSTTYAYDPKKTVPTKGGGNLILGGKGPLDQRDIGDREDYLRFATPPLEEPIEVVGRIYADLYIDSDAPDTDFTAKLVDVYPDGYEALLADGILRARYREGFDREVFLKPGEVATVRVDLWSTSVVFNKGHRIAVHVSSSNDPRFDPNPNTGKPTRADSETRVAHNTIHHDARHPSRVLLPIARTYKSF
jgi:putative CocE/NonD family hydrolase